MEDIGLKRQMTLATGISIIIVIILVVAIALFARRQTNKPINTPNIPEQVVMDDQVKEEEKPTPTTGTLGVRIKGEETTFKPGQAITVFVYADSQGRDITGYDAVIRYDSSKVAFEKVTSLIENMDVYNTKAEVSADFSDVYITGVKSLNTQETFIFSNTALVEVTFHAIEAGDIDVNLVFEPGSNRDSNLIDGTSRDILSSVIGASVKIQ